MTSPEDCHVGLNMEQGIIIHCYHSFLEEFWALLGLKRTNKYLIAKALQNLKKMIESVRPARLIHFHKSSFVSISPTSGVVSGNFAFGHQPGNNIHISISCDNGVSVNLFLPPSFDETCTTIWYLH